MLGLHKFDDSEAVRNGFGVCVFGEGIRLMKLYRLYGRVLFRKASSGILSDKLEFVDYIGVPMYLCHIGI